MEAEKLKKRKIHKGKLKKTLKTVICRPDPIFWPTVTDAEDVTIKTALEKYRVHIAEFKKAHWNDLKSIPKTERPKPPSIKRVEGFIFGVSESYNAVKSENCTAVLIEENVNPQAIVQQIIEVCTANSIPILCLKDLRLISKKYFGIQTICLSVKKDCLQELSDMILEIYQNYKPKPKKVSMPCSDTVNLINIKKQVLSMEVDNNTSYSPYVYRTNKKTRVFIPSNVKEISQPFNKFSGQQFIKVSEEKQENDSKTYMKMILKRITNNPNRVKKKQNL